MRISEFTLKRSENAWHVSKNSINTINIIIMNRRKMVVRVDFPENICLRKPSTLLSILQCLLKKTKQTNTSFWQSFFFELILNWSFVFQMHLMTSVSIVNFWSLDLKSSFQRSLLPLKLVLFVCIFIFNTVDLISLKRGFKILKSFFHKAVLRLLLHKAGPS